MSKKSRSTDNSKRQQPKQQHRAEAARQATGNKQPNGKREMSESQRASRATKE